MTSDLDIYRTAAVLMREHGDNAALEAAQRADAMLMLECGDVEGSAIWLCVLRAVEDIQRKERAPGEAAH
jgi:hypothetical protein